MKKIFLSLLALLSFVVCNAQLKTQSNYDANGDGAVNISDVTAVVNKVLGKATDEEFMINSKSVAAWIKKLEGLMDIQADSHSTLDTRIMNVEKRIKNLVDPYNGHDYVDLGLPSGLKWATCNIGADKPAEYGDYFAWGETAPYYTAGHSQDSPCSNWETGKSGYNWESYQWCNGSSTTMTKYCISYSYGTVDNKTVLDLEDDAANVNWGGEWRIPTQAERTELQNNCYWKWVTSYRGVSVNGYIVYRIKDFADKGKYNPSYKPVGTYSLSDPHIFLPAAGYRSNGDLCEAGSYGYYWSSSLVSSLVSSSALDIYFDSTVVSRYFDSRYLGRSIRAVCR